MSQVTITETTSETTATVEYLDDSDATLTDADTMTAGLQVNLSVGSNIVKVKVTAPDTTTTETYTVNVFRVAVPVACSTASMVNRIWTGNLTVGQSLGSTRGYSSGHGALDNRMFSFKSNAYSIDLVAVNSVGIFSFSLETATLGTDANDLILHVGTEQFALVDADIYSSGSNTYSFFTNAPTWADGDAACLALTVVPPAVSSVALTSAPGSDNTYAIGDDVQATVTFDAAVDITGTPQLELDFAGTAKAATCTAATNTTTMACEYEVAVGDVAAGGVAIAANKLTGGTITATGSTTITADLDHVAVAIDAGHKVDGIRPTLVTTSPDAPTTSTDGTKVILIFSETISGVSRNDITISVTNSGTTTSASPVGSLTTGTGVELTLTTALTATATNLTVELAADAVFDAASNGNLALAATGVTNAVSTTAAVSSVALTSVPNNNTYGIGDDVDATVTFSAAVDITGTPQLELDFAGTAKAAACTAATNTTTMECKYGVVEGDVAAGGVAIGANKLTGGTITATGSTTITADLTHAAVAASTSHKVDGIRPTLVTAGNDAPTTSTDGTKVILTFSENLGSVDQTKITIRAGGNVVSTIGQIVTGTRVELTLMTALTNPSTTLTVELAVGAAEDDAGNGNLAVPATAVTNALGAPDVPQSLSATPGNGQVMLSWVPPSGGAEVTDYEYELDGSGTWISTGSTATSYTVTGLTNGQPYTFRVRAANSAGASAASTASASVTPATVPGAPTGLGATVSDQRVDLSWTAPASDGGQSITDYEYEQGGSGTWISTGGTATTYTVLGLTNGQSYTFRVRAVNRVGAGLESFSESDTPTSTVVEPDTPFGLSATPGNRQVMLSWVQPSGGAALTHYEYEQDGSDTWTSTGSTAPSYTVTGLTNGQSYAFRVRAVNSAGASGASGSQSATPTTTAPEAPESLRFTPGNGQVTLRWKAPPNDGGDTITHYEYEQDRSGIWISTGGTATSHTVRGLNNGQTYTFRVRAVNALGNGDPVTLEATPSPSTGGRGGRGGGGGGGGPQETWPSAPRNLLADAGDQAVTLTWEAPEDDGGSEITDYQYRINGQNPWISTGSTETTYTVTGLVNGTEYTFQVRAVNRIGNSFSSTRAEATPEAPEVFTQDFAHFANGTGITSEMVLVNVAPDPIRPAIYFYDTEGNPIAAESVVDVTGDLEVTEDGSLSVLTEMEPLGVLTISTHGRGELVSGSVRVVSEGPIGGMLRFEHPDFGVAGVGASPPLSDALFPVRRQEGGITTGVALHNLESSPGLLHCDLMREGVLRDSASIPLAANGQTSWLIDQAFPATDTSDFAGLVRCDAVGEGLFSAVALEMDSGNRIFATLPVVPVPEMPDRE